MVQKKKGEKAKNQYDEQTVRDLVEWFTHADLPKEAKLSEGEYIVNMDTFVRANLNDIKHNYPNPVFDSSITRLIRLKEVLETMNKVG